MCWICAVYSTLMVADPGVGSGVGGKVDGKLRLDDGGRPIEDQVLAEPVCPLATSPSESGETPGDGYGSSAGNGGDRGDGVGICSALQARPDPMVLVRAQVEGELSRRGARRVGTCGGEQHAGAQQTQARKCAATAEFCAFSRR